jgi:hypothetical protein
MIHECEMQNAYVYMGSPTQAQKAKEHKTHKLPLNTCTRAKEHTKPTLDTCDKAKIKRDWVAWRKPHNSKSPNYLPWSPTPVHRPQKWCSPLTSPWWGLRTTFDLQSPSSGVDPPKVLQASCLQNQIQERERATDAALGIAQKGSNQCRVNCSKVGLAKSILSKLWPPRENTSRLAGGVRVPWRGKRGS